jgi:hypothetical protein
MTKEIVIDGVNLTELKTKYDALAAEQAVLRNSIRKGASKFMANSVEEMLEAVDDMKNSASVEEAEKHAEKAYELLSEVQFVSEISGIPFDIGYKDEWGYGNGKVVITNVLEDEDNELFEHYWENPIFKKLHRLADGMEQSERDWNSSSC